MTSASKVKQSGVSFGKSAHSHEPYTLTLTAMRKILHIDTRHNYRI